MRETDLIADLLAKPGPSAAAVDEGRRRLRREGVTRRPSRGRLFGGLGGLTALVAGGVAATVVITGGVEQALIQPAGAAETLRQAAERAETTPWGSGRYWYVKANHSMTLGDRALSDKGGATEHWTTRDGRGWFKSDGDLVKIRGVDSFLVCDKEVGFQRIQDLPAEPDALRAELREMMLHNDDGPVPPEYQDRFLISCMIGLLGDQPAPPKVRAAAFRSLAGLPGAERLGAVKDSTGREGTGLVITSGGDGHKLIIDLETSLVLETEYVQPARGAMKPENTRTPAPMKGEVTQNGEKTVQSRTYYKVGWTDAAPS